MILRSRQKLLVERALRALDIHGNTLGVAPTGAGKTICLSAVAGALLQDTDAKACILAHRDELTDQNRSKFARVNPGLTTSVVNAQEKSWAGQATFAMAQTLCREAALQEMPTLDLLVIDECFPAGTLVDGRSIETIREGDYVTAFSVETGLTLRRQVTRLFRQRPKQLMHLCFEDGTDLVCTPAHPIFSPQTGYFTPAVHCRPGQEVLYLENSKNGSLHGVQQAHRNHDQASIVPVQKDREGLLLRSVQKLCDAANKQPNHVANQSAVCLGTYENQKSHGERGQCAKDAGDFTGQEPQTQGAGWKWSASNATTKNAQGTSGRRLGPRVDCAHQKRVRGFSSSLQAGYCASSQKSSDRSGWRFSPFAQRKGAGSEEGRIPKRKRVATVSFLEPSSDGRFGGLCPDGYVYNLEVAEFHNYFANGVLVHNCHHAAAPTYRRIIDTVCDRNPDARIFGVTATPNRGDGAGLRPVFSNVADQITLGELIASGHLVRPRTFVIDLGQQHELKAVRQTAADFDMTAVAAILNTAPINQEVVRHWREKADGRKTIVFCSTVAHATDVCQAFIEDGVGAVLIHGELSDGERKDRLRQYEQGRVKIVVNVAVLTEGYDHPPTSCVVLLRPSSHASTFIQMVGRGLRVVDPEEFPGVIKEDCLILDFGTASLMHGTLEQTVNLDGQEFHGEAPQKECPQCGGWVPLGTRECPLCGFVWDQIDGHDPRPLSDIVMTEIDLLRKSSFLWCDLFGDDGSLMATGFHAWAGVFHLDGHWHAVGGGKNLPTRRLAIGERLVCLAQADDFLNDHETEDAAHKTRAWINQPATEQQLRYLPPTARQDFGLTRYRASALLSFGFNKQAIHRAVGLYA